MADEDTTTAFRLRTISDLKVAGEWMFNAQQAGKLDAKTADAMNTTLKGQRYLVAELPMRFLAVYTQSKIKKFDIPMSMLPEGMRLE